MQGNNTTIPKFPPTLQLLEEIVGELQLFQDNVRQMLFERWLNTFMMMDNSQQSYHVYVSHTKTVLESQTVPVPDPTDGWETKQKQYGHFGKNKVSVVV